MAVGPASNRHVLSPPVAPTACFHWLLTHLARFWKEVANEMIKLETPEHTGRVDDELGRTTKGTRSQSHVPMDIDCNVEPPDKCHVPCCCARCWVEHSVPWRVVISQNEHDLPQYRFPCTENKGRTNFKRLSTHRGNCPGSTVTWMEFCVSCT